MLFEGEMNKKNTSIIVGIILFLSIFIYNWVANNQDEQKNVLPIKNGIAKSNEQNRITEIIDNHTGNDPEELEEFLDNSVSDGNESLADLREALKEGNQDSRELAAVTLARIGTFEAVKMLIQAIKDAYGEEKNNLLQIINIIDSPEALNPLIDELLHVDQADPELNRIIRKSLRNRKNPELVPELIQAIHKTFTKKEEIQVGIVLHGLKEDVNSPHLISAAINTENRQFIPYLLGGLSSVGSQRSIEGIFRVVDNYPGDQSVQSEALKAFGFAKNSQKLQYLQNILTANYKLETKQLSLTALQHDGTIQATNILMQVKPLIHDHELANEIQNILDILPSQANRDDSNHNAEQRH